MKQLLSTLPRITVARPPHPTTDRCRATYAPDHARIGESQEDNGRQIVAEQLYATLKTNHGDIEVRLFPNHAPVTVKNFVELAQGEREWTHPGTGEKSTNRLYDGTIFTVSSAAS